MVEMWSLHLVFGRPLGRFAGDVAIFWEPFWTHGRTNLADMSRFEAQVARHSALNKFHSCAHFAAECHSVNPLQSPISLSLVLEGLRKPFHLKFNRCDFHKKHQCSKRNCKHKCYSNARSSSWIALNLDGTSFCTLIGTDCISLLSITRQIFQFGTFHRRFISRTT